MMTTTSLLPTNNSKRIGANFINRSSSEVYTTDFNYTTNNWPYKWQRLSNWSTASITVLSNGFQISPAAAYSMAVAFGSRVMVTTPSTTYEEAMIRLSFTGFLSGNTSLGIIPGRMHSVSDDIKWILPSAFIGFNVSSSYWFATTRPSNDSWGTTTADNIFQGIDSADVDLISLSTIAATIGTSQSTNYQLLVNIQKGETYTNVRASLAIHGKPAYFVFISGKDVVNNRFNDFFVYGAMPVIYFSNSTSNYAHIAQLGLVAN